jgi:SAM-dependent methyltransferase
VFQGDLTKPLSFAADGQYDLVICPLVMHYLKDWRGVFREFYRVLKPRGVLVFSTHHPFNDWKQFNKEDYFAVELLEDEWEGVGKVEFFRRPLTIICENLASTGFLINRLLEPQPTKEFQRIDPDGYKHLSQNSWFLIIRAVKGTENLN